MAKKLSTGDVPPDEIPEECKRFRWHLTRFEIDRVIHHVHPIPIGRGFHQAHVGGTYGGSFSEFMCTFRDAGVILDDGIGNDLVGRCHWRVKAVHFDSREDFIVEWLPEDTPDDGRFHWSGENSGGGTGSFLISAADLGLTKRVNRDET